MSGGIFSLYVGALDRIFFPLLALNPVLAILLVAVIFSLLSIAISALTINKEAHRELKKKTAALQEEIKVAQKRSDIEAMGKLSKEIMKTSLQILRLRVRGMAITFVIIILFFPWLQHHYGGMTIIELPVSLPLIGSGLGWIWWYILVSLPTVYVARRLLRVEYA